MHARALSFLPLVIGLASCGNSGDIKGKWSEPEQHVTLELKPDQTFAQTIVHGPLSANIAGHYTFGGNHLVLKIEKMDFQGGPAKDTAAMQEAMRKNIGTQDESDIEFLTPDRINIKRGVRQDTFDRVKG